MLSNEEFEEVVKDFAKGQVAVQFAFIDLGVKVKDLQEENGKLRELCGMLYGRLRTAEEVTEMGWIDARLKEHMRELGVEV